MTTKNVFAVLVAVLVLGAGGWYYFSSVKPGAPAPASATANPDTVATVNGENITRTQLTTAEAQLAAQQGLSATSTDVQAQLQTPALNALIAQALLRQTALKSGLTASSTQVDAQVQADKTQLGSDAAYQQALVAQGMTEADLRAQISANLVLQAYLDQQLKLSSITASDAEIQAAYKQLAAGQTGAPALSKVRAQVQQLVIQQKQQQLINALADQLRAQADVKVLI